MTLADELDRWESDVADDTVLRPSDVQNRLLTVHDLVAGSSRLRVEQWLAGTVGRTMYTHDEVAAMIATLRREAEDGELVR